MIDDRKKIKKIYYSFETLREDIQLAIANVKPGKINKAILSKLRYKIEFAVTPEHIQEMFRIINAAPYISSLHFSIVADAKSGRRTNPIIEKAASSLISDAREKMGYPVATDAHATNEMLSDKVIQWVETIMAPQSWSGRGTEDIVIARTALICLLSDKDKPFFIPAILKILSHCIKRPKKSKAGIAPPANPEVIIGGMMVAQFATNKPKALGIKNIIGATEALLGMRRQMGEQVSNIIKERDNTSDENMQLKSEVSDLKKLCNRQEKEISDLQIGLEKANSQASEEHRRYNALEAYWKETSEKERNAALSKIKASLEHEINEILLCLNRKSPNVSMAMDRINNIISLLEKI